MSLVTLEEVLARFPDAYLCGGDVFARADAGLVEFGHEGSAGFYLTPAGQAAYDAAKPVKPSRATRATKPTAAADGADGADGAADAGGELNAELGAGA